MSIETSSVTTTTAISSSSRSSGHVNNKHISIYSRSLYVYVFTLCISLVYCTRVCMCMHAPKPLLPLTVTVNSFFWPTKKCRSKRRGKSNECPARGLLSAAVLERSKGSTGRHGLISKVSPQSFTLHSLTTVHLLLLLL